MVVRLAVCILCVCTSTIAAAPTPKENDDARMRRIYGQPFAFDAAHRYAMVGDRLRVFAAPDGGTREQFGRLASPVGAPRVWRAIKGDFTVTTKVSFPEPAPGDRFATRRARLEVERAKTAGLVAWEESDNFFALWRVGVSGPGIEMCFTHPNGVRTGQAADVPDSAELYLRLRRAGTSVTAGFSADGKAWKELLPDEVDWGDVVKVGVYVQNRSAKAYETVFDEYELKLPQK